MVGRSLKLKLAVKKKVFKFLLFCYVAFPPVEKFHNLKQRKKSLISGAKLKTFEKHISNSILNMVIFENWSKMD